MRENFITEDLLADGGTVTGIRGQEKGSPSVAEPARLVIGADGKHSTVARAVNAGSYRARPPLSMAFYTYWADVPVTGGELYARPGCAVGAWPTNDGLVMTYLAWPNARFGEFRADPEGNFLRTLDAVGLGERIRAGRRAERFRGTPDLPSFFRKPYGPGWALVGDAGLLLDPITGQGIGDAFRDAELLAGAVVAGLGGDRRWPRRSPAISGPATARPGPSTTSRPGSPRSARRARGRRPCSRRCHAASRTPTGSSPCWPGWCRCGSSCRRAPSSAWSGCADSRGSWPVRPAAATRPLARRGPGPAPASPNHSGPEEPGGGSAGSGLTRPSLRRSGFPGAAA